MNEDESGKALRQFKQVLDDWQQEEADKRERDLISSHYGVKDTDFRKQIGEIMGLIMSTDHKNEVIDQLFPTLKAEERLTVEAYAAAKDMLHTMQRNM